MLKTRLVPAARLFELLASSGLQHILHSSGWTANITDGLEEDEEDEENDIMATFRRNRMRRRPRRVQQFPKVPSDEGTELMGQGEFGTDPYFVDRLKKRKRGFASNLMWRELGVDAFGVRRRADFALAQVSIYQPLSRKSMFNTFPGLNTWLSR